PFGSLDTVLSARARHILFADDMLAVGGQIKLDLVAGPRIEHHLAQRRHFIGCDGKRPALADIGRAAIAGAAYGETIVSADGNGAQYAALECQHAVIRAGADAALNGVGG